MFRRRRRRRRAEAAASLAALDLDAASGKPPHPTSESAFFNPLDESASRERLTFAQAARRVTKRASLTPRTSLAAQFRCAT